jgi:hypothetical protein
MPQFEIKALRHITDGGHNIEAGKVATVDLAYANEWIARGWADPVKSKTAK